MSKLASGAYQVTWAVGIPVTISTALSPSLPIVLAQPRWLFALSLSPALPHRFLSSSLCSSSPPPKKKHLGYGLYPPFQMLHWHVQEDVFSLILLLLGKHVRPNDSHILSALGKKSLIMFLIISSPSVFPLLSISGLWGVVDRIIVLQRCLHPDSQLLWPPAVRWQPGSPAN